MNRSKYHAKPRLVGGIRFASTAEAIRFASLEVEQRLGDISGLRLQVPYSLMVGETTIGKYVADFVYIRGGIEVIEDVKGVLTPLCAWKLKHMAAQGNTVSLYPPIHR